MKTLLIILMLAFTLFAQAPVADPDVYIEISVNVNTVIDRWEVFWEERTADTLWYLVAGVQYNDLIQHVAVSHSLPADTGRVVNVDHPTVSDGLKVRVAAVCFDAQNNILCAIGVSRTYHKAEEYESFTPSVVIRNLNEQ